MRFVTVREFRGSSGKVWRELAQEKEMIITSNGKPVAILSAVSEAKVEETLAAIRRARAIQAVERLHRESVRQGTELLSAGDVEEEIQAVRKRRRK
ncbi:MAG: type II toxin-antitoxin system Phd/YefM family antitoxin [Acidobacteriota bacterium]